MLRACLLRSRAFTAGAVAPRVGTQWLLTQRPTISRLSQASIRQFADTKKPDDTTVSGSDSAKTPENVSESSPLATRSNPAPGQQVPTGDAPKPPPATEEVSAAKATEPAPPPPPPKKKPRRFRNFLIRLFILAALGYGGGVYYSLMNDNFHDFFTEYIPYGEEVVAYFEEQEFRKRFPGTLANAKLHQQVRGENKVNIPSKSGVSWKVVEEEDKRSVDLGVKGRHISALEGTNKDAEKPGETPVPDQKAKATEQPKIKSDPGAEKLTNSHTHDLLPKDAVSDAAKAQKTEPVKPEPPQSAPAPLVDNITISEGEESVTQDVVKLLNDLITVINADDAAGKYSSAIDKAKGDLDKVVNDITNLKAQARGAAEDMIRKNHVEFDDAAKELIRRLEAEMQDQEHRWKEDYEAEREKLSQAYQSKLKSELEATSKLYEQRLKNELLEQSIALKRGFSETVRDRVEHERSGRLSRLSELSDSVAELEQLTAEWNDVLEANLKTQHLMVAVEAVRATLEKADRPKPFVEELAALKEVAADDPVVNAAIASINPTAYQRGIPTMSQLLDRFRRVAGEVRKAALLPENAGVASHAASLVLSKFLFKKQGLPVGDDVESVLTRTEVLLEEGDLDGATREMNALKGWAKVLASDWLGECRRVLEVRQALDVITTEARLQSLLID